jgi:hypothetical protein
MSLFRLTLCEFKWYNFFMQKRIILYSNLLFILLIATSNVLASTPPSRINSLRQSVLALDSAWTRAIADLQDKKKSGSLEKAEKQDYAKFITYLSGRIDYYCDLLRTEGDEQATVNLPCADSSAIDAAQEQLASSTKAEQIADLDKSLAEALGEFDEQLLKEDQRIAARMPSERESGNGYGGSGNSGNSGQNGSGQQPGDKQTGTAGNNQGQETSQSGSANPQNGQDSTSSSSGAGTGVGSEEQKDDSRTGTKEIASGYDDIVARQLREAAEKETDPELKEKLWEEYRKYKEGIN